MITTINGVDAIARLGNGEFRAHRQKTFWVGDFPTFSAARRALQIANSAYADEGQRGIYDGGAGATEQQHNQAIAAFFSGDPFGASQPVTLDDVRCTVLPHEPFSLIGGLFPSRNKGNKP
jgi:hypothetical protein